MGTACEPWTIKEGTIDYVLSVLCVNYKQWKERYL